MIGKATASTSKDKTRDTQKRSRASSSPIARWALVRTIVDWVRREVFPDAGPAARYEKFLEKLGKVVRTQGTRGAIAFAKRRRAEVLGYLSTEPGTSQNRKYRLKLISAWGHRGAEAVLKFEVPAIRFCLTACASLRGFRLPVKVDLSPITKAGPPQEDLDKVFGEAEVKSFWTELRRAFRVPKLKSVRFKE